MKICEGRIGKGHCGLAWLAGLANVPALILQPWAISPDQWKTPNYRQTSENCQIIARPVKNARLLPYQWKAPDYCQTGEKCQIIVRPVKNTRLLPDQWKTPDYRQTNETHQIIARPVKNTILLPDQWKMPDYLAPDCMVKSWQAPYLNTDTNWNSVDKRNTTTISILRQQKTSTLFFHELAVIQSEFPPFYSHVWDVQPTWLSKCHCDKVGGLVDCAEHEFIYRCCFAQWWLGTRYL